MQPTVVSQMSRMTGQWSPRRGGNPSGRKCGFRILFRDRDPAVTKGTSGDDYDVEGFEKATDHQFKEEDIERAKALVGRCGATATTTRCLPRRTTAPPTRWGGQVAAPMIHIALNRPLYADPPEERTKRPSFRGIDVFVSGSTWQWYRPVMEGDSLYSFGGMEPVLEKKSEFAERSLLVAGTSVKVNQRATVALPSREHGSVRLPEPPADLVAQAVQMLERHHEIVAERRAGGEG
jgi:hypothetical protein